MTASRRLARRLRLALDPLRARLRRDEIAAVARALAQGPLRGRREPHPLALAMALLDHADQAAAEAVRLEDELERLGAALAVHGKAAAPALLADHARGRGEAALSDADAAAERQARAIARQHGTRELCLFAAGTLAAEAAAAARLDGAVAAPAPLSPERAVPARLLAHAADPGPPWPARVAALEGLTRLLKAAWWPADADLVDRLDALADDARDHRWVQVAAVRALGGADVGRARARVRSRLLRPRLAADDALVRARLAGLCAGELGDLQAGAALAEAAGDVAEHVRQAAARACRACGEPAARQILAGLCDPARERSPRVRGVAAQVLGARAGGAAGDPERLEAARSLAALVTGDPDPLVRRVGADAAADACADADADAEVADLLVAALDAARGSPLPPATLSVVARAAERAHAARPDRARLRRVLAEAVGRLPERGRTIVRLPDGAGDDELGRALAELAQEDFGLYARRRGDALVLRRGEKVTRRAWRVLHELTHPIPSKRQGFVHTVGRDLDAPLRAHPALLAEVTRTRVPGERVLVPREGSWGPYLPLVDDLLACAVADRRPAKLFSEHGTTELEPPASVAARLLAGAQVTGRYAELSELRLRALEAGDAAGRATYLAAVAELGFEVRFRPWPGARAPRHVLELFPPAAIVADAGEPALSTPMAALVPFLPMGELFADLGDRGGDVAALTAFTAGAAALLLARSAATRAEVRACRRAIPLVVGGWGTRGKSGVERLKAALFHSLGYEVLVKTTGCEATVLCGTPGRQLVEVPLYRPYEKATIWEQRDILRLAGTRRPHVLLWECMALNPRYVDLLQRGWMRDDISTLTNAYPDHEDIQGPSGMDVARTIAGFTPSRATLVTAEEQMLPVIRERARLQKTRLVAVGPHDHELLPPELLDRFPYKEHPRNVALVLALADELGIDRDVALVEMAEHVLPDIGGLKSYGPYELAGRKVRFANGMSANERASALGNWRRLGFDAHEVDAEPGRFIVGFVNNRADRAARTLTFADAIVEDLAAHRFVLCGTNTGGLKRAILDAFEARLQRLRGAEVDDLLRKLKIGAATPAAALAEVAAWAGLPAGGPPLAVDVDLAAVLTPAGVETPATARKAVAASGAAARLEAALATRGVDPARAAELGRYAVESWARRRAGAGVRAAPDDPGARRTLSRLFEEILVEPADPLAPADELIDALALSCPPGAAVDVMGLQNIKGPGLEVIYRFAAAEQAVADVAALRTTAPPARAAAARRLRELDGGRHVLAIAAAAAAERASGAAEDERALLEALARELRERAAAGGGPRAATSRGARALLKRAVAWARRSLDHFPSVGRRRRADDLFEELADGRASAVRAAREVEKLLAAQRR